MHSLNSIFAERSDSLKKDTLNVEYVQPLLLHIFAWINLLNGHALKDNLEPNIWKVNERITQPNSEAEIEQFPERHLNFFTVA